MRVLGIDIGSRCIRAVELDSAFGRVEVHEYHEHPIRDGVTPEQAVGELIAQLPRKPDKISFALRTQQTTLRNIELPTRDRKSVFSSVGFELDDDLPFEIEDATYEALILSQTSNSSRVHVAATLSSTLKKTIEDLQAAGVDPDVITTEAWAVRSVVNRWFPIPQAKSKVAVLPEQTAPNLVIHIGEKSTLLLGYQLGQPIFARQIGFGGQDITHAIGARYQIGIEEAENAKLTNGFVLSRSQREQGTPEQIEFSDAVQVAADELMREVRHAVLTAKNLTHQSIATLTLSGQTAMLPGLGRLLEEEIRIPVRLAKSLSMVGVSTITYSEKAELSFVLALGAALCLVGPDKNRVLNLRKGEFVKRSQSTPLGISNYRRPALALTAVILCFFASALFQRWHYQKQLKTADTQLEKSLKGFFGQLSTSALKTYTSNPTTLRKKIKDDLEKQRQIAQLAAPNRRSPSIFLKDLSLSVPKDVVVDLIQVQVGASATEPFKMDAPQTVTLEWITHSLESANRLKSILEKKLTDAKFSDPTEVPGKDPKSKRYKMTVTGVPYGGIYGT
jgi:type IV pilus assembly protein PilM